MDRSEKTEELKPHIYLFDMMAEKLGDNLELAIVEGQIEAAEVVEAAFRCAACPQADTCAKELPKADTIEKPFAFCRNQALFSKV